MEQNLFSEFPPVSTEEWKDKLLRDLKRLDMEYRLTWNTKEGFDLPPYYRAEDLDDLDIVNRKSDEMPFTRFSGKNGNDWKIRQDFASVNDLKKHQEKLSRAVKGGAEALGFSLSGLRKIDRRLFSAIARGVDPQKFDLYFSGIADPMSFVNTFFSCAKEKHADIKDLKGSFGFDPLSMMATQGSMPFSMQELAGAFKMAEAAPNMKIITVHAGIFPDAGAMLFQEVGYALTMANTYIEELSTLGIPVEKIVERMTFCMVTGPNYFMEIAKLRAARWLWSVFCEAWGLAPTRYPMHIQSRTATWNRTIYDPHVNLLRGTTETMAASMGGSDVISVLPFDIAFSEENIFSTRLARNIQIILKEEAYLDKVTDPAGGSYYIEELTQKIGELAWNHFVAIDNKGGFIKAFEDGWITDMVECSARERKDRAARRKDTILGVNHYPDADEEVKVNIPLESNNQPGNVIRPLKVAEDFELLRLSTTELNKRPRVFLLKYGNPARVTARSAFATNFFGAAGYKILDTPVYKYLDDGVKAARKSGADIVVLCSADETYPEMARAAFDKIKNGTDIVVAGYPTTLIENLKDTGIKHFIHVRSNLLEELWGFQKIMQSKYANS